MRLCVTVHIETKHFNMSISVDPQQIVEEILIQVGNRLLQKGVVVDIRMLELFRLQNNEEFEVSRDGIIEDSLIEQDKLIVRLSFNM